MFQTILAETPPYKLQEDTDHSLHSLAAGGFFFQSSNNKFHVPESLSTCLGQYIAIIHVHTKIMALPSVTSNLPCHGLSSLRVGRQSAIQFNHNIYFSTEKLLMEQRDNFLINMTSRKGLNHTICLGCTLTWSPRKYK